MSGIPGVSIDSFAIPFVSNSLSGTFGFPPHRLCSVSGSRWLLHSAPEGHFRGSMNPNFFDIGGFYMMLGGSPENFMSLIP